MKIFISADIEGVNGVVSKNEVTKGNGEFGYFANKMTEEVNAVCMGINNFAPYADILVKDAHADARNIDHSKLPHNARLCRGWAGKPGGMVNFLDSSFDAAIFTGYHSPSYTNGNPLAHTMNSSKISKITVNGMIAGEFHLNYYASLSVGVPVVLVSGDKYLTELITQFDESIITVAAMECHGNGSTSLHPGNTQNQLREAAKKAMTQINTIKEAQLDTGNKLPKHFEIEITYKRHFDAMKSSFYPGMKLLDEMTLGFECDNIFDFLRAWMFV
jgi:D-amino peptidase